MLKLPVLFRVAYVFDLIDQVLEKLDEVSD
jgi:hypothetical protein